MTPPTWPRPPRHQGYRRFHDPRERHKSRIILPAEGELVKPEPAPYAEYDGQPSKFLRDIVGVTLYPKQEDVLEATARHRLVTVASCHSAGKSFLAACCLVYRFNVYRPMLGMSTAPGFTQVRDLIWREVGKLYTRSRKPLHGTPLTVRLEGDPEWWARGIAAKDPNHFQGRHGVRVFIVVDEGQGIKKKEIWEAIEANTSGGDAYILLLGNPVVDEGYFYDSHHTDERWLRFNIDAFETPNLVDRGEVAGDPRWRRFFSTFNPDLVASGGELIPGLASKEWVESMRRKTGGRGREWETRVRGRFYKGTDEITDTNRIGPKAWLAAATARWRSMNQDGMTVHLGVDVGGDGKDESAIAVRRGRKVERVRAWPNPRSRRPTWKPKSTMLGRIAFKMAWKLRAVSIAIDMGGGWGSGCRDAANDARREFLRELKRRKKAGQWGPEEREALRWVRNLVIVGVVPTKKPRNGDRYRFRRDEVWHGVRELLDPENPGAWALPEDEVMLRQFNQIRWGRDGKDKIWVWGHDKMASKGLGSPDRAQAVVLTAVTESDEGPPAAGITGGGEPDEAPAVATEGAGRKKARPRTRDAFVTRGGVEIPRANIPRPSLAGPSWRSR